MSRRKPQVWKLKGPKWRTAAAKRFVLEMRKDHKPDDDIIDGLLEVLAICEGEVLSLEELTRMAQGPRSPRSTQTSSAPRRR